MSRNLAEHSNTFFIDDAHKLNRKKERQRRTKGKTSDNMSRHDLIRLTIKTEAQHHAVDALQNASTVMLYGSAGTGKTFLALHYAISQILDPESGYSKIIIIKTILPVKDIGFLPGTLEEKIAVYEVPYQAIVTELTGHATGYDRFKERGLLEFHSTSFLRGVTFNDAIIIFDEFQGTTFQEFDTVATRIGDNCKFIICGDLKQCDLNSRQGTSSFSDAHAVLSNIEGVAMIEFMPEDIVRSGFVRDWILAKERLRL